MKTALLIPILNERDGLEAVLPEINPAWVDEILFVDGGSTDGSQEVIRSWGHGRLIEQRLRGLSNAYWEAFPLIASDVIVVFSPDGNSLASAIPRLIEKMGEGYDMVVASRYLPGARSQDDGLITSLGNWVFTRMVNLLFGAGVTDSLVMFRAYRKSLIEEIAMDTRAPAFEPQLSIRCAVYRRKVAEIAASEPRRIGGKRKMSILFNGWAVLKLIVQEWFRAHRKVRGRVAAEEVS